MDNSEVIEQLVEINEEVDKLREHPDENTLELLLRHIIASQSLILKYTPKEGGEARMVKAYLKMLKVEQLARDYASLHEEPFSLSDLEVVFDSYQEAFEAFFFNI